MEEVKFEIQIQVSTRGTVPKRARPPKAPPPTMPPTLDDVEGDGDARTSEFFAAYANELPPGDAEVCKNIGESFASLHLPRLCKLFKLARNKALARIKKADAGMSDVDADAWLESIELNAGFEFRSQSVPASAALAETGLREPGEKAVRPRKPQELTISQELGAAVGDEVIPEWCYDVIKTCDPLLNTIREPELEAFTEGLLTAYGERFLRFNLGRPLCRHLGAQILKKLKLPLYGGRERNPANIMYEKARNRKVVSTVPFIPVPRSLALARIRVPRSWRMSCS
jgi:hypothetical protein